MANGETGQTRSICGIGLKSVINALQPSNPSVIELVSQESVKPLVLMIGRHPDMTVRIEACEILSAILSRFGASLTTQHNDILECLLISLSDSNSPLRKRAVQTLGALTWTASDEAYTASLTYVLCRIDSVISSLTVPADVIVAEIPLLQRPSLSAALKSPVNMEEFKTLFQCLAILARSPQRMSSQVPSLLENLITLLRQPCVAITALKGGRQSSGEEEDADEIRELGIQVLDILIRRAAWLVAPKLTEIVTLLLEFLQHDPNYAYGPDGKNRSQMDIDARTDEDDDVFSGDEDEDDEAYSDEDEDSSWKVRRAAAKGLEACISSYPEHLGDFYETVAPALVSRFDERVESVRLEIFACTSVLLSKTRVTVMHGRADTPSVHGPSWTQKVAELNSRLVDPKSPQTQLLKLLPVLCQAISRQVSPQASSGGRRSSGQTAKANLPSRQAAFLLLRGLAWALPGHLGPHLGTILGLISADLTEQGTSNTAKIEMVNLLILLVKTHDYLCFADLKDLLNKLTIMAVSDSFYRVALDGMDLAQQLTVRPKDSRDDLRPIFPALMAQLKATASDLELKEKAVSTVSVYLSFLGDHLPQADLKECLSVLLSRLKNESTRLVTVRAINKICTVQLNVDLTDFLKETVAELASCLNKKDRLLRIAALRCLTAIFTILTYLPQLISDHDLQTSQGTVQLVATMLEFSSKAGDVVSGRVVDLITSDAFLNPLVVLAHSTLLHVHLSFLASFRLFGGLVADLKRRAPHYLSDFTDAIHIQCFASFFFLYFACLAPIITFGGLLSTVTGGYLGTMESIVSGAVVGILYALFSGQPLTIMGSTGPVLVFEGIIYRLCTNNRWAYLSFRFWIGMWTSFLLLIMVAFDLSALVRFITRFTEESFALLIALIFIVEAFQKTFSISKVYPVNLNWSPAVFPPMDCRCIPPANISNQQNLDQARHDHPMLDLPFIGTNDTDAHHPSNNNSIIDWERITSDLYTWDALETQKRCRILKGVWNSKACEAFYAPDVFFFCCLLFLSCFLLSYALRSIRTSRFFPSRIRSLIADFGVMIAIIICTLVDYFCGLHTPKLQVPTEFEPTLGYGKRGWLIPPFNGNPWWSSLLALGPALLAVILIFMDQQITAVIINRRENKLKKGEGYHLDLLIVAITLATNSLLGIPWFVAATVLSINHVLSLKKVSESAAPGEQPVFLGCREQRVTGFLIFLFIGLSVFMSHILRLIPMAVLYGVFLLMGITSLNGLQFIQRCLLIFMPGKYQPDYPYLSHVRLWRVHLFTVIQLVCLVLLWVIKSIHQVSILFPLMVLAMCFIRKGLDFVFTQHEMHWLDDVLPESSCSRKSKKTAPDFNSKTTIDSPPISEPLLLKPDDRPFSVSEEVSKTLIWRQLSGIGLVEQGDDDSEDVKKGHRRRRKGNRDATDDGGDSSREHASRAKRRHSHGNRLRVLRLFSADATAGIGTEIPVLYRNTTDSDIAQTATDDGGSISGGGRKFNAGCTQSNNSALAADHLTPPVIQINPPSSQCSPNSSRRNSRL
ncbi:hypothetical protein AAHC03_024532 [Spirometra sp. Aus1]